MPINHQGFTFLHLVHRGDDDFETVRVRCEDCGKEQTLGRSLEAAKPGTYQVLLAGGIQVSCGNTACEQSEAYRVDDVLTQ